jgi:3-hydroxyacyl-[acyl-carrier-protein] dehydratase
MIVTNSVTHTILQGTQNVLSSLPHRPPFLLIDQIIACEEGCWIRATRGLTINDPLLSEQGTLPAPLLVEAIAQAATALLLSSRPGAIPLFLGIEKATFVSTACAGDRLDLYAEVCWLRRRVGRARGEAISSTGIVLCRAEFTFGWLLPDQYQAARQNNGHLEE